jgi:hypothetical protein
VWGVDCGVWWGTIFKSAKWYFFKKNNKKLKKKLCSDPGSNRGIVEP